MSIADSLVTPSLDWTLYGESAAPKKRSVVCLLSHPYVSACKGPRLRSRISLHLLFLVLGARFVNEPRDAHTHACPGAVYPSTRQFPDQLGSISPFLSAPLRDSEWEPYRRTSLSPTKNVHPSHRPVNLAETPWPFFLPRFLIICLILVILFKDIILVELEKRLDLCHHPGQRYVGLALIRISATNILMYAREPILKHLCQFGEFGYWWRYHILVLDWLRCCEASPTHLAVKQLRYS